MSIHVVKGNVPRWHIRYQIVGDRDDPFASSIAWCGHRGTSGIYGIGSPIQNLNNACRYCVYNFERKIPGYCPDCGHTEHMENGKCLFGPGTRPT